MSVPGDHLSGHGLGLKTHSLNHKSLKGRIRLAKGAHRTRELSIGDVLKGGLQALDVAG